MDRAVGWLGADLNLVELSGKRLGQEDDGVCLYGPLLQGRFEG